MPRPFSGNAQQQIIMTRRKIRIIFWFLLTALALTEMKAQHLDGQLKKLSDASNDDSIFSQSKISDVLPYKSAIQEWKTISDVSNWIQNNFRYSMERAKQLAENSSERERIDIYSPDQLYQAKKGVCIDLSRFAVETINIIDSSKHVQYLMIEFEPIIIDSSVLKKHWMAVYHDSIGYYFLADSKRPGYIAGPHKNIDDFIFEYQTFRDRKIVSWKVLLSYGKKRKKMQQKQE